MKYKVAIPSIYRADILNQCTLSFLKQSKVDMERVYVFTTADCLQEYKKKLPNDINIIEHGCNGIQETRNYIRRFFKHGETIVGMDDDVKGFWEMVDSKTIKPNKELTLLTNLIVKHMEINRTKLGGVNMVTNPFFMNHKIHTKNCLLPACFYVFINDHNIMMENPFKLTEDGEMCIKVFKEFGSLIRLNYIGLDMLPNKLTEGGIQKIMTNDERSIIQKKSDEWLVQEYPEYCSIKKNGVGLRYKTPKVRNQEKLF